MNLVQAKPLSHKLSDMDYKNDKIKDKTFRKHHTFCKVIMFCCLTQKPIKGYCCLFPASDFVMGLCVTLIVSIAHAALSF